MSGRGDTISREMAIGVVGRRCGMCIQGILDIPSAEPDILTCADCCHADGQIADGRYWCDLHGTFMRYCSDAERRQ